MKNFLFLLMASVSLYLPAQTDFAAKLQQPSFLDVEQAFAFDFEQQGQQLIVSWNIADGYYLYKNQFRVVSNDASVSMQPMTQGVEKYDEFFGDTVVYYGQAVMTVAIAQAAKDAVVKIRYQGCAEAGLCYPPTVKEVYLQQVGESDTNASQNNQSQQFELANMLSSDQALWLSLGLFLGLGVLFAFTPCVFPMYPILSCVLCWSTFKHDSSSEIIVCLRSRDGNHYHYSVSLLRLWGQFQVVQHPVVLSVMMIVFVMAALAMFGAYEIQLPSSWQQKLNNLSQQQKSGQYAGVFVMGIISGLVASPCTTAPLTGILLFVAQSGDLFLGFSALYAGLGMGIPILFAVTGGKLLPKAGQWMNVIRRYLVSCYCVTIVFFERMVIAPWTQWLWIGLLFAVVVYLVVASRDYLGSVKSCILVTGRTIAIGSRIPHSAAITDKARTRDSICRCQRHEGL